MSAFLTGLFVGFTVLISIVAVLFPVIRSLILNWLASRDLFFTLVEEGTAKAIMINDQFNRFVMAYAGYGFDEEWNIWPLDWKNTAIYPEAAKLHQSFKINAPVGEVAERRGLDRHLPGGIRWLGIPFVATVYHYAFQWSTVVDTPEGGTTSRGVKHYEEQLGHILLKDYNYFARLESAETREGKNEPGVPLSIEILFPIRIMNPYLALFRAHKWLAQVLDLSRSHVRQWVAERSYANVLLKKEAIERDSDMQILKDIIEYCETTFGARIKRVMFLDITPSPEYQRITTKKYEAEREKEKIEIEAAAEANRISNIVAAVNKGGEVGRLVLATDTLQAGFKDPAAKVVLVGGVTDLLQGLVGKIAGEKK